MKDQDAKSPIEFRKVYLSDLKTLISIYQHTNERLAACELTAHFGFPLNIATQQNKIIGFAFASITESEETMIGAHCLNATDADLADALKAEAEKTLYATFEGIGQDSTPLKNSIAQLLSWLNVCAN